VDDEADRTPGGLSVGLGRRSAALAGVAALARVAAVGRLAAIFGLAGCAEQATPSVATPPLPGPPPGPAPALPFDAAVLKAADALLASAAEAVLPSGGTRAVVIDPLIDGATGDQSAATETIGTRIAALARQKYQRFDIQSFTPQAISRSPCVILGTFTPVNAQNKSAGERNAFWFCLVMADLGSGKVVAKATGRALLEGVDTTPTTFFRDSPAWTDDAQVTAYVKTCQATKVGDAISPLYLDGIVAAAVINEAIEAYAAGRYAEAGELYARARADRGGNQLRVYNGLYLCNWKLGRRAQAAAAFGEAVNHGLANGRLGVKILFRPGAVAPDQGDGQAYDMWIRQIADGAARRRACLEVVGNTSKSGSAALNERLSLARAEFVKARLQADVPALAGHLVARGAGAQANLVGTGADDATDALDRRVEFVVMPAC
jgi:hypothetical protein